MELSIKRSSRRNKILYWVFTSWMCLGMVSTAIVQLIQQKDEVAMMTHLGYPIYFLTIIGVWKILGVVAALIPTFTLAKEWAYAGFFFAMSGAVGSHLMVGDPFSAIFPSLLLLTLTIVSYCFRPANRRLVAVNQ